MSIDITRIINIFSKFLDPKIAKLNKLKSLEEIKLLPVHAFKFINKDESKHLKDILGIMTLEETSKINKDEPFAKFLNSPEDKNQQFEILIMESPDIEERMKKAITISSIITDIRDDEFTSQKLAQKIIVIGLDNAGKTAILTKFGGHLGIGDLASLKPTKGVDRHYIKTEESELDLYVWDMGGQQEYRSKYLKHPEHYFLEVDLLIYVIDVQDAERYPDSFEYFEKILAILHTLEENPFILIYIHKVDPDLKHDPEILLSIELLKENINQLLNQYGFDYEAYLTSVYSLISNEPQFSKYIKEVMKNADSLTNPTLRKVEGLGKTLEETMNAVIRLSESLSKQLNELDGRLRAIESGAFQIAQSGIPVDITSPNQGNTQGRPGDTRSEVLDELKQLFDKKRKLNL